MDEQNTSTPPPVDMRNIMALIFENLQKQGLSFLLLGMAVYHFQTQNMELRKEVSSCQNSQIQLLMEQNQKMINVIEKNTLAIQTLSK